MVEELRQVPFSRDTLLDAVQQANKAIFEKAMQEFLRTHPEHQELNEGVIDWVEKNQERIRRAINKDKPDAVSPEAMYYSAYHAIRDLLQTKKGQVVTGWGIGDYFPFAMGLVHVKRTDDSRYETYELTPTVEGMALFEKCFPGREEDKRTVTVAFIGDPLDPADGHNRKRGRNNKPE